jgi:hypothetical protein
MTLKGNHHVYMITPPLRFESRDRGGLCSIDHPIWKNKSKLESGFLLAWLDQIVGTRGGGTGNEYRKLAGSCEGR